MDPYRLPPDYRRGGGRDFGLLAMFFLTILLMAGVVAILTAGWAWQPPPLPSLTSGIAPVETRSSGLFGAGVIDEPSAVEEPADPELAVATAEPPTATAVPSTPTPEPTATATAEPASFYVIGNTGGVGAWLRRSPRMNDYLMAWVDGTRMEAIGPDVEADGRLWRNVRDPRGNRGYIPAEWLIPVE